MAAGSRQSTDGDGSGRYVDPPRYAQTLSPQNQKNTAAEKGRRIEVLVVVKK